MAKYSKEFKEEALKLSYEIGVKKAAAQLGLQYFTLADWCKDRKFRERHTVVLTDFEAKVRISELEKENAQLRQANEILKDALGFLQKHSPLSGYFLHEYSAFEIFKHKV